MTFSHITCLATALILLSGCAATIDQRGLEQRTSQAIGRSTGQFTITERSEEAGGHINYTVKTKDGGTYRCYMYSTTGLMNAMSFGQMTHSGAICTAMDGTPPSSKQHRNNAGGTCNALLQAAGRC
jgi:hypothetical protein